MSRVVGETSLFQRQPCTFFHILLFVKENISHVYWIKFIKCLRDCDITKQIYIMFHLLEAEYCCRASLERPAFHSGSPVCFNSYSVICYGKYFTIYFSLVFIVVLLVMVNISQMFFYKVHNFSLWLRNSKAKSISFIGGCTLLSRVDEETRLSQRQLCRLFHILLFVIAKISQVHWIKFIKCLRDCDITKQIYTVFLL